jgi:hypothetical protein
MSRSTLRTEAEAVGAGLKPARTEFGAAFTPNPISAKQIIFSACDHGKD